MKRFVAVLLVSSLHAPFAHAVGWWETGSLLQWIRDHKADTITAEAKAQRSPQEPRPVLPKRALPGPVRQ
jgi:hypothetical protein